MFRTDRGTVVAACLMSALGCLMACALLGFPATGGVRFAWVLLWATASVAGMRFLRVQDRRAKACFGTFCALFLLALALGYRLDTAGQTGIEGLLLSLGTALCLGPAAGWVALWLDERMAALVPPQSATPPPAPPSAPPATAPPNATPAPARRPRPPARPPRARPPARPPRARPTARPPRPRPKARPPRPRPKAPPPRPRPKARPPRPRPKARPTRARPKTQQPPRPASPGTPCWPPWS